MKLDGRVANEPTARDHALPVLLDATNQLCTYYGNSRVGDATAETDGKWDLGSPDLSLAAKCTRTVNVLRRGRGTFNYLR